jgi:excisionase family DNA binding protein
MGDPPPGRFDPLDLLTLTQVSQLLNRSRRSLYDDRMAGRLRVVHLGGSIRVPRMEVERFLYGDNEPEPDE